jgi:hypothetical protein
MGLISMQNGPLNDPGGDGALHKSRRGLDTSMGAALRRCGAAEERAGAAIV